MSAFKRRQSKVFWSHMEDQDLAIAPIPRGNDSQELQINLNLSRDEEAESSNVQDTTDDADITAIRVYRNSVHSFGETAGNFSFQKENDRSNRQATANAENCNKDETNVSLENRSCSPLSQDLRSQDSGFSDSERSNCSENYETPRRRRRRKKVSRRVVGEERVREGPRQLMHPRVSSLWQEENALPNPAFTSTPKESRSKNRYNSRSTCASRNEKTEDEAEEAPAVSSVSFEEECLGDFLYLAEPPEDAEERKPARSPADSFGRDSDWQTLESRQYRQSSSVRAWLTDLTVETENECGITLQSKCLPRRKYERLVSEEEQMKDLKAMCSIATSAANKLLTRIDQFEQHYRHIVDKVSHLEAGREEKELLRVIEESAFLVLSELGAPAPRRIQLGSLRNILLQLENMKSYVDSVLDTRLDFYIEKVVRGLEEAPTDDNSVLRGALAALTVLGLSGPRAGSSVARCSGIRALLTCLISTTKSSNDLATASLRALASVCSSTKAISQFVKDGGPEILTDLLAAENTPEREKMEATALVVQITAPWTNAAGLAHLEPFANSLVPSLKRLIESSDCSQTLLLAAAALNHLSKSRHCASIILREDVLRKLLKSVKKSTGGNVWLMEQVASLVGELAKIPEARQHLAKARASVALVCFLRMRPPGLEDAYRRLEMTAAAALTRLCVDPEIARQVVAVGGADCLPSYTVDDQTEDEEVGLLKYTKSLRRACKRATKQIDIAKACDYGAL